MTTNSQVAASGGEGQANLNIWLKDVSVYAPGIHRSVLKRQLILACREFFEQSWAWRATLGPIPIIAEQATYMLSPFNSTTDVVGVLGVYVNGIPIGPAVQKPEWPPPTVPLSTVNMPATYYMLRPDVLALYPVPNPTPGTIVTMDVHCALKPKATQSQVPHVAVSDYYEAILAGVLYRILNQPAKPYSNPSLSMYFESRFRTLIGTYAAQGKKGNNGGANWRFPYFGNPRRWGQGGAW